MAVGFPTTGVVDQFTRANETPMSGSGWTTKVRSGDINPNLASNAVTPSSTSGVASAYRTTAVGPDSEAFLTINQLPANLLYVSVYARVTSPGSVSSMTGYELRVTYNSGAADTWQLYRYTGSVPTAIGPTGSQDIAVGRKIGLQVIGSTLKAFYHDGTSWQSTPLITFSDGTYTGSGVIGLGMEAGGVKWIVDDFGGGTAITFPTTSVLTAFPGANEDPISEAGDWGTPIESGTSNMRVVSNQAAAPGAGGNAQAYRSYLASNDTEAWATVAAIGPSGDGVGVWARVQNPGNTTTAKAYIANFVWGTGWQLYKLTAGHTYTQILSTVTTPVIAAGDALGIEVIGTAIRVLHKPSGGVWAAIITATDSTVTGAGTIGMQVAGATPRLDDFGGNAAVLSSVLVGSAALTMAGVLAGGSVPGLTTGEAAVTMGGTGVASVAFTPFAGGTVFPSLLVEVDFTNDPTDSIRVWTPITGDVRAISYQRAGRNNELQRTEAGTLTMLLDNRSGNYDPTNPAGAHYPGVRRMRWVRVRAEWDGVVYPRWMGLIESWRQEWPGAGSDAIVTVTASDAFKALNLFDLEGLSFGSETTGARVQSVLDEVGVTSYDLDAGQTVLPTVGPFDNASPALGHLSDVEDTENGLLFAAADGSIVFQDRHYRLLNSAAAVGTIGDEPGEIPYRTAELDLDDAEIWNEAAVTPEGGTAEIASDPASITRHYRRRLNKSILSTSQPEALNAAEYLVARYSDPLPRIPNIEVLAAAAPGSWPLVLTAENSDRFTWKRRADAHTIDEDVFVERVADEIVVGSEWRVTFELSPADNQSGWILGDAVYGVLGDTTRLVY